VNTHPHKVEQLPEDSTHPTGVYHYQSVSARAGTTREVKLDGIGLHVPAQSQFAITKSPEGCKQDFRFQPFADHRKLAPTSAVHALPAVSHAMATRGKYIGTGATTHFIVHAGGMGADGKAVDTAHISYDCTKTWEDKLATKCAVEEQTWEVWCVVSSQGFLRIRLILHRMLPWQSGALGQRF